MMLEVVRRGRTLAGVAAAAALVASGCGGNIKGDRADLVNGKQLFASKCSSCHTLARADAKGTVGPNLDEAFAQSRADGLGQSTIRGVVKEQILYPPRSGKMPNKIVTGQDAIDVAAYVAHAAAKKGQDEGALATAVESVEQKSVTAQGGKLEIDADPNGQLAFLAKDATAKAGKLELTSKNASSTPHNIALEDESGKVLGSGKVVSGGAVSTVSVDVKPGTYTFFCAVQGHREGGMQGKLTVR